MSTGKFIDYYGTPILLGAGAIAILFAPEVPIPLIAFCWIGFLITLAIGIESHAQHL